MVTKDPHVFLAWFLLWIWWSEWICWYVLGFEKVKLRAHLSSTKEGPLHGKTIRLKVLALSGGVAFGMEGVKKYGLIDTSKDSQG